MSALVHYDAGADGIAVLTLDDPPANTYSYEMMKQLDAAILEARMDAAVHALLLRGAGEKFFCAGADIKMLATAEPRFKYNFCLHANETLNRLEQTPKPVIAALGGHCVGGGLEVALAADLRVARAHTLGLVNVVFEGDDFWGQVAAYAQQFVPPGKAARAVGRIKRAVQSGLETDLASGLALERELQQQLFESADAREGITAFSEKRKPQFTGK